VGAEDVIAAIVERLELDVSLDRITSWRVRDLCYRATVTRGSEAGSFVGYGTGATVQEARARAVMEWVERYAQFGPAPPRTARTARAASIADVAILPPTLGLYARSQYIAGFPCVPFSMDDPIAWVEGADLADGRRRLVPVEFVYPRAPLGRPPLACETSSGTAAHVDPIAAALAAVCEAIERDAFLIFWYRMPPTPTLSLRSLPPFAGAEELRALQAMGFVVMICCLDSGLGVPCFLALALRGTALAYGLGCHPSATLALEHAAAELLGGVTWVIESGPEALLYRALPEVRAPRDHYQLYHHGPLHGALRQALAQVLLRPSDQHPWQSAGVPLSDEAALRGVLERLAGRGYSAIGFDLTPTELAQTGCHVTRVLVPGLVPMHFGMDRIRLGCQRLIGRDAPGRLSTLLPHFLH